MAKPEDLASERQVWSDALQDGEKKLVNESENEEHRSIGHSQKKKKGGILPRRSDGKFTARTETIRKIVNHSSSDQYSALKLRYQISATQAHGQVHTSINDRWKEMEKKREGGPESVSVPLLLAG